jgi:hypothetical protein
VVESHVLARVDAGGVAVRGGILSVRPVELLRWAGVYYKCLCKRRGDAQRAVASGVKVYHTPSRLPSG